MTAQGLDARHPATACQASQLVNGPGPGCEERRAGGVPPLEGKLGPCVPVRSVLECPGICSLAAWSTLISPCPGPAQGRSADPRHGPARLALRSGWRGGGAASRRAAGLDRLPDSGAPGGPGVLIDAREVSIQGQVQLVGGWVDIPQACTCCSSQSPGRHRPGRPRQADRRRATQVVHRGRPGAFAAGTRTTARQAGLANSAGPSGRGQGTLLATIAAKAFPDKPLPSNFDLYSS